jgi:hypothetical protein
VSASSINSGLRKIMIKRTVIPLSLVQSYLRTYISPWPFLIWITLFRHASLLQTDGRTMKLVSWTLFAISINRRVLF